MEPEELETITAADLLKIPPETRWGSWEQTPEGLWHRGMDYLVRWEQLASRTQILGIILHLSGKNKRVYGEMVVSDLVDAINGSLDLRFNAPEEEHIDWRAARARHMKLVAERTGQLPGVPREER